MIRRFYVMPLNRGVSGEEIARLVRAMSDSDMFISGLSHSSAGVDRDGRTVVWEMSFLDEETYTGPYMVHPYHAATLDGFLISDSPECITHDIATMRYEHSEPLLSATAGVRRVVLLRTAPDADTSALRELSARNVHAVSSVFAADDIAWRFPGRSQPWTHVLEQTFLDIDQVDEYLATAEGIATSSREGVLRLGVDVQSLQTLTYPFLVKPQPLSPGTPADDAPVLYTVTARLNPEDVEAYIEALRRDYDPPLARAGAQLVHRRRSIDQGYGESEIQSTWQLESVAAYSRVRLLTVTDPDINRFVLEAMPLVRGGTRRFYRSV